MNKIYKVIFNRNKNRYEIVSELASSRGGKCKVKAGKQIAKLFMTGLLATSLSSVALAADEEVKVKYDETTGTIKIVKTDPSTNAETILATYAVGGNIAPITGDKKNNYPKNTIALGENSSTLQNNTIAIGTAAHAGDASGSVTQSDGKIAIGNKTVASGDRSIALGNQSTTNKGSYNIVQGNDSIGIGTSTSVFGYSGVSIGRRNIIGVPDPDLVNNRVLTTKSKTPDKKGVDKEAAPGGNSVIVGAYNVAYGSRSSIIGTYSRAMGNNSVAIGSGVQSLTDGAIAIGKGSGYEFEDGSRKKGREKEFYGRDWELPPEYKVLKQVLSTDIAGDEQYKGETGIKWKNGGTLPKYNNYGAGSSDPGGFIVEGKNALGIGTYTQVRGDSAIGLATGEMTADLSLKDKSAYAKDMGKIMDMEETLYLAKEELKSGSTSDKATLEANVDAAEKSLAAAKKDFREKYLKKYSFVEGEGALGVGRQILAQGDRSMAVGDYAKAISNDAIAYGGKTLANGTNSMAMGGNAHVGTEGTEGTEGNSFNNSMAIGSHTNVQADNAVALGAFSQVTGENSLALGFGKQDGNNINYNAVSGKDSTLIGSYGTVQGNNSILIGSSGSIANDRVVALGNNIHIAAAKSDDDQENNTAGSVFLGDHAGYVTDSKRARSLGEVDVVGSKEKMELTESLSSTKGALRDYTKDFIYIYMLERQDDGTQIGAPIAVRSDFAGGDSTVGVVSVGSTYEQNFENIDEIRKYHTEVGSLITVPVKDIEVEVTKNGISLGKQKQTRYFAADSTRDDIYADKTLLSDEDREKVWNAIQEKRDTPNSTYTVFETRRIQNVAPGLIGVNSTDAINGSQLFATNQMLGNLVGSLKKTFGDNVTITEDGQIGPKDKDTPFTLGWIAKADSVDGSNGTVSYEVDKAEGETEEANKEKVNKLKSTGYVVDAAKTMTFKAGKNIGLVQKPGELSISTVDTPRFTSVELRGNETTTDDGKKVTEVTKIDSSGMKVVTETSTPASDGGATVTEKVSTTVGKDGVSTDGSVKVTNGTTDLVTIDKGTDGSGTDKEYGKIGLDGKNGSNATITVDRGTSSLDDTKNIGGTDPKQDISENNPAKMDRITYTTKNKDDKDVITHEVATMDDGLFFQGDVSSATGTNNTFSRKLSEKVSIVGEVKDGLEKEDATAEEKAEAIRAKLSDGNIGVVSNGTDTLTIKLAKNLVNLTSVETGSGDNKTKMTENGITTTVKDGDTFKVTTTTPNGLATTEVKLDREGMPKGESTTTMVTTDGVTITTQTPKNGDKPASTTETKLSKDGLATDGTIKVIGDNAKDLVTIGKGTETDPNATDKEFGTVAIDGKNGSNATLTVDRGTKSVTDKANILKDPKQPAEDNNPVSMDRLTYTTTGADGKSIIKHEVATLDDGFFLTTEHTEEDKTRTVLFNHTIKVLDGANTKVSAMGGEDGTHTFSIDVTGLPMTYTATDANGKTQDVHKVGDTYTLADGTKLVQVGDKFYKPDQVEEVNGTPQVKAAQEDKDTKLNNISLTSPVANTAPTLSNVGSALKKSDGTRITMSNLDDSSVYPTNNPIWNNAVNVGDLKAATDAARTEVTGTGKAIVTKKTGDKGQNIYNVHVDPIVDVVGADGSKVVRGDDGKYYNPTDIANKTYIPNADGNGGNWYDNGDLTNGEPNQGAKPQTVKTADIKNSIVNPNSNDSIVLDNVKSGIGGKVDDPEHEHKNTFMENVDTIGKANGISENTVVNAGDLKNLVDTGFKLNTSGHSGEAKTVKIGETIKVVDGANTKVSAIDDSTTGTYTFHIDVTGLPVTYTATETDGEGKPTGTPVDVTKTKDGYQKADGTPLIKINENGKDVYYTAGQLDNNVPKPGAKGLTITDNIRLINPKDGTGATKITNVAAGTDDTDAVNVSQLKQKVAAATTEVTGTGAAEVTKVTGADGQNVYNVHVDKLMEAKSTEPGKTIVRGSDNKYYYVDDALKQANDGKWYPADQVGADGKPADGAVGKDTTELTVVPADKLKNSLVNPNGNGPTIVDNVKSVLDGSGIGNGADMSSKIDTIENGKPVDTAGSNQFIKDLTGLNPTTDADKLNSVSTVSDLQKVALTPLFFEGDTAESAATNNAFGRKLSEKAKIVGGQKDVTTLTDNNIGVVSNGSDTLTVKLAKELTNLTSVTTVDETNGTKTTVSGKGITTDGKVVVNNGKTGDEAKEFVTIDKGTDGSGTDKEYGKIGLDGKNGSNATITIDRGTKSLNDDVNIGVDPSQPVSETNKSATMDRITYTTKGANGDINHEVATLDDGFMLTTSTDVANSKAPANVKLNNTVKFTDGANTKVSTVTSKDGVHELHIDVTGLPVTYTATKTDAQGNVVGNPVNVSKVGDTYQDAAGNKLIKVGDKYYRPDQLVDPNVPNPKVKDAEKANGLTITDSISLVNNDGTTNPTTLKNVGSGLKDANGNDTTLD
ncbi:ESPR-type extended signal peptide-containing protein, partial [Gallibacterium anatis]|uniref:ESPR-type extended signal peptide-containing protein n=1 Tax=Gallibacterium anatis TaxID=750 RepID=UPI0009BFF8C3